MRLMTHAPLLVLALAAAASALNCYVDLEASVTNDCNMHTGCAKHFEPKTQRTVHRGCILSNGRNDTCFVNAEGLGICHCHTDLCNSAEVTAVATRMAVAAAFVFPSLLALQ